MKDDTTIERWYNGREVFWMMASAAGENYRYGPKRSQTTRPASEWIIAVAQIIVKASESEQSRWFKSGFQGIPRTTAEEGPNAQQVCELERKIICDSFEGRRRPELVKG